MNDNGRRRGPSSALALLALISFALQPARAGEDLSRQAAAIMAAPDVALSLTRVLPGRVEVLERALRKPILLLRLWEAYRFSPRYKARPIGDADFHLDDPTGIEGDVFLVGVSGRSRSYLALGAVNHRLVPRFRGKAVVVIAATPSEAGLATRVDFYLRMDSRLLGFFVGLISPLLKPPAQHRIDSNLADLGTILGDLAERPRETAAKLGRDDAATLLELLAPK